jgi:ubiquinone/menaquinone biosynthesis C-methylase UbiE
LSERLLTHYEAKYANGQDVIEAIATYATPRDRFEACMVHFPRHFTGGSILELAAGNGRMAKSLLATDLPCSEYTLSDLAEARLEAIRTASPDPRMRFTRLDAGDLRDEPSARFDAIIMLALIEHLIDPIGAMTEIRRMLCPGGFVYINTPNIAKFTRRLRLLAGRFPSTASRDEGLSTFSGQPVDLFEEGHLHYFTYRSLSRILTERCGFSRVEKLAYYEGPSLLSRRVEAALAHAWPEMFSELCLVAYS